MSIYLVAAYSVFWALTFALVLSMVARQRGITRDIAMLQAQLEGVESAAGDVEHRE